MSEPEDDALITMADCTQVGFCPSGVRRRFHENDLDFHDFMRNGVRASVLLNTGDPEGRVLVEHTQRVRSEDFTITMADCIRAGHCASGVRRWFNEHGLDFRDFMRNGIPASVMLAQNDGQGRQVVERTLKHRRES